MHALETIAALVHRESGIVIGAGQLDALAATLARIDPRHDPDEFLRGLSDPAAGPRRLARLIDEITVKETFFLRHSEQLEQIEWAALLRQSRANGSEKVRVWSAGCATGEEAYSLALLACEAFGTLEPPVEILATDISGAALESAELGEYRPRSTRELDPVRRKLYFDEEGECLTAGDRLRALVTFVRHNLVTERRPPHGWTVFDLILCRNVLIYFDNATVAAVLSSLEAALAPSGTLILGAADTLCRGAARLQALAEVAPRLPDAPAIRVFRRPLGRHAPPGGRPEPAPPRSDGARTDDLPGPTADFLRGLAELEASNPDAAAAALRRALYADPTFGIAAFQLGRCYEALADPHAARRAYEQALRTLGPDGNDRDDLLLEQVSLDDVRAAIAVRIDALRDEPAPGDPRHPGPVPAPIRLRESI